MSFDDQVVFINGAAGGAGRVIAQMFADRGARVIASDVDQAAVTDLAATRADIRAVCSDSSRPEEVASIFEHLVGEHGRIDVLINNVGIGGPTAKVEDIGLDDWSRTMDVNVNSYFYSTRCAVPLMKKQGGGVIINVSSSSAKTGLPLRLPYVVSKAAVIGMTANLARELGPFGIRVNAILPGAIEGDRIRRVIAAKAQALGIDEDAYRASLLRYISMKTTVTAEEIGESMIFLASNAARHITGQMLGVDGNAEYEE